MAYLQVSSERIDNSALEAHSVPKAGLLSFSGAHACLGTPPCSLVEFVTSAMAWLSRVEVEVDVNEAYMF